MLLLRHDIYVCGIYECSIEHIYLSMYVGRYVGMFTTYVGRLFMFMLLKNLKLKSVFIYPFPLTQHATKF